MIQRTRVLEDVVELPMPMRAANTMNLDLRDRLLYDAVVVDDRDSVCPSTGVADAHLALGDLSRSLDLLQEWYHARLRNHVPELRRLVDSVARERGHIFAELDQIAHLFHEAADALEAHVDREERIVFAHIRAMIREAMALRSIKLPSFGTIANPADVLSIEHDYAVGLLDEIRALTSDLSAPVDSGDRVGTLYAHLKEFDRELREHVSFEDDIVFPSAIELERRICAGADSDGSASVPIPSPELSLEQESHRRNDYACHCALDEADTLEW